MRVQILTSSYPAFPGDPGGAAGLFVSDFAHALARAGHDVLVQPIARHRSYAPDDPLIIEPLPWRGGNVELASLTPWNPHHLFAAWRLFPEASQAALAAHRKHQIDRTLCMWAIPCGEIGWRVHRATGAPFDIWALGSDIWKIRKIPLLGPAWLRRVLTGATRLYADGLELGDQVQDISRRPCRFLPSCRHVPRAATTACLPDGPPWRFLFVGRYHPNKGPDLLLEAAELLRPSHLNHLQLTLHGLGPMEQNLQHRARLLGQRPVQVGGPLQAMEFREALGRTHFLVIPSRIESIPVVFSDALQAGVPVITTPVGDLPRLIREYHCGVLAESVTAQGIAKAIQEAMHRGPGAFREGVKRAAQVFNLEASVKTWLVAIS